jgi:hypothetical protein
MPVEFDRVSLLSMLLVLHKNATNAAWAPGVVHPGRPEATGSYASSFTTELTTQQPCGRRIGKERGLDSSNREASVG